MEQQQYNEHMWLLILWIVGAALLWMMFGCGMEGEEQKKEDSCTTIQTTQGAEIKCPDGSHSKIANGSVGPEGPKGEQQEPCKVERVEGGALISCEQSQVVLFDGKDGKEAAQTVVKAVPFCERPTAAWPEVGIFLEDGTIVALFTEGSPTTTRLVILQPGWYSTTDAESCLFRVNDDLTIGY
jgi:hypothetical protein